MKLFEAFQQGQSSRLDKDISRLEQAVRVAQESGENISANYHDNRDSKGGKLQERVRLITRDIIVHYIDATAGCGCGCGHKGDLDENGNPPSLKRVTPVDLMGHSTGLSEDILNRVLSALESARELFGNHSYHHVIEGRIAFIVKREAGTGFKIPESFNSYRSFQFQDWNDPWTNYCCHKDLLKHGFADMVPPEYREI